jgi:hypothetical protein
LEQTNGIRFLRKPYRDPITRGGQWRIIHLGEARLRADDPFHVSPDFGSGIAGAAVPQPLPAANSIMQSANQGLLQSSVPGSYRPASTNQPFGFSSIQAAPAAPGTGTPAAGDPSATGSQIGSDGQVLGGVGIVGVASLSPRKSMREYKHQQHYNEWEFTYDASQEVLGASGLGLPRPAQPAQNVPPTGALLPNALQPAAPPPPPPDPNAPGADPQ